MKNELILKIEERYADMRTSEQKVADYIMDHMDEIPKMSLGKIASECNVSEPTVLRMVKAIGYQGLREFRTAVISAIETILRRGNQAEVKVEHGKVVIVEVQRKKRV